MTSVINNGTLSKAIIIYEKID